MGLSLSVSAAIVFTAAMISFGILFSAVLDFNKDVEEGQRNITTMAELSGRQQIEIVSVNGSGIIILVNKGSEVVDLDSVFVFINGTIANDLVESMNVDGSTRTKLWAPTEFLEIRMRCRLENAKIMVVAGSFARAYAG
ncbi:MAG: hypothetical protein QW087_07740 [Methanomassiliicoccales archaeon]